MVLFDDASRCQFVLKGFPAPIGGLFDESPEHSVRMGVRGGAGRIRTSNQTVMSEAPTRADPEHADLGARLPRHHPSLRGALRRASDIAAGRLYPCIVGEYCD